MHCSQVHQDFLKHITFGVQNSKIKRINGRQNALAIHINKIFVWMKTVQSINVWIHVRTVSRCTQHFHNTGNIQSTVPGTEEHGTYGIEWGSHQLKKTDFYVNLNIHVYNFIAFSIWKLTVPSDTVSSLPSSFGNHWSCVLKHKGSKWTQHEGKVWNHQTTGLNDVDLVERWQWYLHEGPSG